MGQRTKGNQQFKKALTQLWQHLLCGIFQEGHIHDDSPAFIQQLKDELEPREEKEKKKKRKLTFQWRQTPQGPVEKTPALSHLCTAGGSHAQAAPCGFLYNYKLQLQKQGKKKKEKKGLFEN